jgi:hypothetical protein
MRKANPEIVRNRLHCFASGATAVHLLDLFGGNFCESVAFPAIVRGSPAPLAYHVSHVVGGSS